VTTALAVVLILAGIGFIAIELFAPGFGGPGTAAILCFVIAALLLIDERTTIRIPASTIVAVTIAGVVMIGIVTTIAVRLRGVPPKTPSRVLGEIGVATSDLDPVGTVRVLAEEWTAESEAGPIETGARIRVVGEHGLTLRVDRFSEEV
jgi:membrane-bound serine protease (ClpP class)